MTMRVMTMAAAILAASASVTLAQGYKKEIPGALAKRAKVTETLAAKAALARVPNGDVQAVELEEENGKLIYSYDIKVPGKSGIEEVAVSAISGKVLSVEHETPATEKKEAAADRKAAAKKKP